MTGFRPIARCFKTDSQLLGTVLKDREPAFSFESSMLRIGDGETAGGRQFCGMEFVHFYHRGGGLLYRGAIPQVWMNRRRTLVLRYGELVHELESSCLFIGDGKTVGGICAYTNILE